MSETLKQRVARASAEGLGADAILKAAAEWMKADARTPVELGGDGVDHFLLSREWAVVRMVALERDGGRCACCGRTADDGITINVDHIRPRRKYPELALSVTNLQVLCNECNRGKGNKFETEWRRKPGRKPKAAIPNATA